VAAADRAAARTRELGRFADFAEYVADQLEQHIGPADEIR
jgi:hypothetical protein